ncbi:hypothetical protein [Mesorhizobium sp. WSM3862]|uniref:hypothetical protein n=1 Tax=Mesorhizobium sp. WSM3862 TaxID=632858 RepID=UPI000BAED9DD|nr:hypothetical protein [Mesorhizobium sp. WSM3862]PBB96242.1 hypothetical protein CK224_21865 [Mesorhizobium sp. WSM3862]
MTSAALVRQEKYQIGRVFNNTFSVIGRNIVLCVGLAALFSGLPQLVTQLVRLNSHPGNPANFAKAITNYKLGFIIGTAVIVMLYLAFAVLLQSSLVRVAIEDMNGKKPTFRDSIATAIRFLLPTVAIGLLVALGVGAASIALLVPGIILGLGWSVAEVLMSGSPAESLPENRHPGLKSERDRELFLQPAVLADTGNTRNNCKSTGRSSQFLANLL